MRYFLVAAMGLTAALLSTSCGSQSTPTDWNPDPDPVGTPARPTGAASASGDFVFSAPELRVASSPSGLATAAPMPLREVWGLGIFKSDYAYLLTTDQQFAQRPQRKAPFRFELPFLIRELPAGHYEAGIYEGVSIDFDFLGYQQQAAFGAFDLTPQQPALEDLEIPVNLNYSAEGCTLQGEWQFSGVPPIDGKLNLTLRPVAPKEGDPVEVRQPVSWAADLAGGQYSRVFYEVRGLAPGIYGLSLYPNGAVPELAVETRNAMGVELLQGSQMEIAAGLTEGRLDLRLQQEPYFVTGPGFQGELASGRIECRVEIHGDSNAEDTIVVIARQQDGVVLPAQAQACLHPAELTAGEAVELTLSPLPVGRYRLDAYRLAADGAGDPVHIGGVPEDVIIEAPDYSHWTPVSLFDYPPLPVANTGMRLDL